MRAASLCFMTGPAFLLIGACNSTPSGDGGIGGMAGEASGGAATGGQSGGQGGETSGGGGTGGGGTGGGGTGGQGAGGGSGGISATCGDGNIDADEDCDDGGETEECNADCTNRVCGDEFVNEAAGEECDEGEATDTCNADCTEAECGNGVTDDLEECDDGEETDQCNANCTEAMCGDGVPNASAGEECDDGGNWDKCDEDCTTAECGDEFHNPEAGEERDGEPFFMLGGTTKTYLTENSCLECVANVCGDDEQLTAVDTYYCAFYPDVCQPEQCDDGNQDSGDGCSYPACEVE